MPDGVPVVSAPGGWAAVPAGTDAALVVLPELGEVRVQQGMKERSNVNATYELVQMIAGMRQHEAATNAMRAISEALEQHASPQGV